MWIYNLSKLKCSSPVPPDIEAVVTRRIFVLCQRKKSFYEGSVLLWYSTVIKRLFDADRDKKTLVMTAPNLWIMKIIYATIFYKFERDTALRYETGFISA